MCGAELCRRQITESSKSHHILRLLTKDIYISIVTAQLVLQLVRLFVCVTLGVLLLNA